MLPVVIPERFYRESSPSTNAGPHASGHEHRSGPPSLRFRLRGRAGPPVPPVLRCLISTRGRWRIHDDCETIPAPSKNSTTPVSSEYSTPTTRRPSTHHQFQMRLSLRPCGYVSPMVAPVASSHVRRFFSVASRVCRLLHRTLSKQLTRSQRVPPEELPDRHPLPAFQLQLFNREKMIGGGNEQPPAIK